MKKKLLALFLGILMIASCLIGCQQQEEESLVGDENEADEGAMTLTLWLPTYEGTTDEAVAKVEAAINLLTTSKYSTAIELKLIPSENYESEVRKKLAELEAYYAESETGLMGTPETGEIMVGENSAIYPLASENQMDIFLIRGYDDYKEYYDKGYLEELTSEISTTGKLLNQYIYPTYMNMAKIYGDIYAVPNNHMIGEYEFLLINKDLVDRLYYHIDDLSTLTRCQQFVEDVAKYTDVTPFLAPVDEPSGMHYHSADGSPSVLISRLTSGVSYNTVMNISSVVGNATYTSTIKMMKLFEEKGYFAEDPDNCTEFGVGVVKGGYDIYEKYGDDYYVSIYDYPTADTEEIFSSMFAVSVYRRSLTRSVEIITMLNTDPELRTILQYGVEGVHWEIDEDNPDTIIKLSDDYNMKLSETGNEYMTYPDYGAKRDAWEYAKKQNLESIISPFTMFKIEVNSENKQYLDELAKVSKDVFKRIEEVSYDEFDDLIATLKDEIKNNKKIQWLLDDSGDEGKKYTIAYQYASFCLDNGYDTGA